jgi:predicted HD phosphohydrolase
MNSIESNASCALNSLKLAKNTDYIGEQVSQLEHSLQSAYFAEHAGHSREVILACLFHDLGHFASDTNQHNMANLGVVHHEWIGAKLAYDLGFSAKVALLIGYHVDAKRYLSGKKSNYFNRLSEASKGTLAFQGGVMEESEQLLFENNPLFKEILQVRVNDEKAKEVGLQVPDLDYYSKYVQEHLRSNIHQHPEINLPDYVDKTWVEQFRLFLEEQANGNMS